MGKVVLCQASFQPDYWNSICIEFRRLKATPRCYASMLQTPIDTSVIDDKGSRTHPSTLPCSHDYINMLKADHALSTACDLPRME